MKAKRMTQKQLFNVCQNNKFIMVRYHHGQTAGINCKIAIQLVRRHGLKPRKQTNVISYWPIGFDEYITYKLPIH